MLNSFDKGLADRQSPTALHSSTDTGGEAEDRLLGLMPPPHQGAMMRLFVRRWLIALFAVVVFILSAIYGLPWYAEAIAFCAYAAGAALIPRSGLNPLSRPVILTSAPQRDAGETARTIIGGLPEPAIILSKEGLILAFNERASDVFPGLKEGFHISSTIRNPNVLDAVQMSGPDNRHRVVTLSDRVPVERHMAADVSYLEPGRGGKDAEILLFLRDLTEQRRLDQLRSDFIANASHEIKTPLASLLGFIETLQGAARHDEMARERFLAIMAKQAQRMARLIDNLMALSRVEMRAHLKPQDAVLIAELAAQSCEALEPMAAEANVRVTVQSNLHGIAVRGDRDELAQVFINLLHNAIKYGHSGGSVVVRIERQHIGATPMIAITVEDDGPGIPSQHLPRLTERFYRVQSSAALEKGGTGLGLAIVKHVVNRHRGELRILSEEGIGSKFTVLLPEHEPARAGIPATM